MHYLNISNILNTIITLLAESCETGFEQSMVGYIPLKSAPPQVMISEQFLKVWTKHLACQFVLMLSETGGDQYQIRIIMVIMVFRRSDIQSKK